LFRRVYYDDWLPNPARIKVAFTKQRLEGGIGYLTDAFEWLKPAAVVLALALVLALIVPRIRRRFLPVAFIAVGWSAYVAFIGGDIFPGRRHIVPLVYASAFGAAELLAFVEEVLSTRVPLNLGTKLLRFAALLGLSGFVLNKLHEKQSTDPQAQYAVQERWEWDGEVIGRLLKKAFQDKQPLLAVDPAGCVPYYSQLRSIDMLGLNDRHIARRQIQGFGTGFLAHESGDGEYVLGLNPDLVLFCLPYGSDGPCFRSGIEMRYTPKFQSEYRLLTFRGTQPHEFSSRIWTRIESPAIGIQRQGGSLTIPGYLFADGNAVASLNPERKIVARLSPGGTGSLKQLRLEPGHYHVSSDVSQKVLVGITGAANASFAPSADFTLATAGAVDVLLRNATTGDADVGLARINRL
jgi:hypothetical protein